MSKTGSPAQAVSQLLLPESAHGETQRLLLLGKELFPAMVPEHTQLGVLHMGSCFKVTCCFYCYYDKTSHSCRIHKYGFSAPCTCDPSPLLTSFIAYYSVWQTMSR